MNCKRVAGVFFVLVMCLAGAVVMYLGIPMPYEEPESWKDGAVKKIDIEQLGSGERLLHRQLGALYESDDTEMSCKDGYEDTCNTENCNTDKLRLVGAFLLPYEPLGRGSMFEKCGGHHQLYRNGEVVPDKEMDYACGCPTETDYARPHSATYPSCGMRVVGLDVYTLNDGWGDVNQQRDLDGTSWTYILQDDIDFSADLVDTIEKVAAGTLADDKMYTFGYTFDVPRDGSSGCQVTYRVDFQMGNSTDSSSSSSSSAT